MPLTPTLRPNLMPEIDTFNRSIDEIVIAIEAIKEHFTENFPEGDWDDDNSDS